MVVGLSRFIVPEAAVVVVAAAAAVDAFTRLCTCAAGHGFLQIHSDAQTSHTRRGAAFADPSLLAVARMVNRSLAASDVPPLGLLPEHVWRMCEGRVEQRRKRVGCVRWEW